MSQVPAGAAGRYRRPAILRRTGLLRRHLLDSPPRVVLVLFLLADVVGTGLLMLPAATEDGERTDLLTALFHATSAVCVTGLVTVDTATHWSVFGELVLLGLIQVGGLGIMTFASLLGLLVTRRLGLRTRLLTQAETRAVDLGTLRRLLVGIGVVALAVELLVAAAVALRLWLGHGEEPGRAAYLGLFHAVSSFNNAGFALWPDNLISFGTDAGVLLPLMAAFVVGGVGYPVIIEMLRGARPRDWSLHTRITLTTTAVLLVAGAAAMGFLEWSNPRTFGPMDLGGKLVASVFAGATPRTAGFNAIDYGDATASTLLATDALMFVGGGPAGTAGGIKVTTFTVLLLAMVAEIRGDPEVVAGARRIDHTTVRQALTVALLSLALLAASTEFLLRLSGLPLDNVMFEVFSAFATVGLSTGITADLPAAGQLLLVLLMLAGRVGPITVATALALRHRPRLYRPPQSRPIVG